LRFFFGGSTGLPSSATCAAPSVGASVVGASAAAASTAFGFHTVVHSVRSSRSAHALSVDGMKEYSSMKSYDLKHGWRRVAIAYVRLVLGARRVIQRCTQSSCMSVRASSMPGCISSGSSS
jgi:hypothetical protein